MCTPPTEQSARAPAWGAGFEATPPLAGRRSGQHVKNRPMVCPSTVGNLRLHPHTHLHLHLHPHPHLHSHPHPRSRSHPHPRIRPHPHPHPYPHPRPHPHPHPPLLSVRASSLSSLRSSGVPLPSEAPPWPPWPPFWGGGARSEAPAAALSLGAARRWPLSAARLRWGRVVALAGSGQRPGGAGGGLTGAGVLGGRVITYAAPLLCCCSSVGGGV